MQIYSPVLGISDMRSKFFFQLIWIWIQIFYVFFDRYWTHETKKHILVSRSIWNENTSDRDIYIFFNWYQTHETKRHALVSKGIWNENTSEKDISPNRNQDFHIWTKSFWKNEIHIFHWKLNSSILKMCSRKKKFQIII